MMKNTNGALSIVDGRLHVEVGDTSITTPVEAKNATFLRDCFEFGDEGYETFDGVDVSVERDGLGDDGVFLVEFVWPGPQTFTVRTVGLYVTHDNAQALIPALG